MSVLIFLAFALVGAALVGIAQYLKKFATAREVDDLREKVQGLEGQLNAMKGSVNSTATVPIGERSNKEEHDLKPLTKIVAQVAKVPPKIVKSSQPIAAAKPSTKDKVKPTTDQRLPRVDAQSIEMKLGTYWFVRIGVVLVLTGLGILAYYKRSFFIELTPFAKVILFYLLSAMMGGVGFWLQRTKEQLKNYGQVLIAGGFSGIYFTTYAAHVIEPIRVIPNANVTLLLLFAWGGFMVWFADRLKSETIALFATGASYYATYIPMIHTDGVSHWVIIFSNLVLAVGAVVFMLRNRWLKIPVLSLLASYSGFLLWRIRVDEPSLAIVVSFSVSLWLVYTAAVFLARSGAFRDRQRAAFLTANNAAMFGLITADVLKYHEPEFWILPMLVGLALLACTLSAARWLEDQSLSRKSYLTQGLVLVTLGLMTMEMADSVQGPILAAESVVLLFMAIRRDNFIIQIGALVVSAVALVYTLIDIGNHSPDYFLGGLSVMVFLLFNARLCHGHIESAVGSILRLRVSYLTGLGLFVGLAAFLTEPVKYALSEEWLPVILLAVTVLLTASVYRLRLREFMLMGQLPGVIGLLLAISLTEKASGFNWQFFCVLALTLGQVHWWRWQGARLIDCCPDSFLTKRLPMIIEAMLSFGFGLLLFFCLCGGESIDHKWLWMGALISICMTAYAVFTRARFVGLFSQGYLLISCCVMFGLCISGDREHSTFALIPIVTMCLMNIIVPIVIARIGQVPEMILSWVGWIQLVYRVSAAALGLFWIGNYIPDDWQVLVFIEVGMVLFIMQFLRPAREWQWLALAYAAIGYLFLFTQFIDNKALWPSLVAIVTLFGIQQLSRRFKIEKNIPDWIHQWLILVGGGLLFIWLSINASELGGHGMRTIAWSLLAVIYFGSGLGLRERWYRLMGLGTLAIALLSLVPIIWGMSTEMKIASFFVMGGVFLGLGFVYNRYRESLKKLL
ncbi:MAG: hypothetical protein CMO69_07800 [Verrucomicrobiales bacterium]|nr:hypothetical protein [Verrucomicrobiales bacterium]